MSQGGTKRRCRTVSSLAKLGGPKRHAAVAQRWLLAHNAQCAQVVRGDAATLHPRSYGPTRPRGTRWRCHAASSRIGLYESKRYDVAVTRCALAHQARCVQVVRRDRATLSLRSYGSTSLSCTKSRCHAASSLIWPYTPSLSISPSLSLSLSRSLSLPSLRDPSRRLPMFGAFCWV